jgi:hypothetical protein
MIAGRTRFRSTKLSESQFEGELQAVRPITQPLIQNRFLRDRRRVNAADCVTIRGTSMGLGTKKRQQQTADICKQHLWEKYRDQRVLVEEFIVEIEGTAKNCDVTRWRRFTDIKDIKIEMLKRLEAHFEKWLNS